MTPELDHAAAEAMRSAFAESRGYYEPTACELLTALAVGRHETGFGTLGQWPGSNNWGSIVCPRRTHQEGECFEGNMRGVGRVRWRKYPSPKAGAAGLLHELERRQAVRAAMAAGDVRAMAEAMRASAYFIAPSSASYAKALERHVRELEQSLGLKCAKSTSSSGPGLGLAVALATCWAWLKGGRKR